MLKKILGKYWKIKSYHQRFVIIYDVNNPADIRRLSYDGWDKAEKVKKVVDIQG